MMGGFGMVEKKLKKRDRRRDEFLKKLGWKILRVKSRRKVPDANVLYNEIENLKRSDMCYREIVLDDWEKSDT